MFVRRLALVAFAIVLAFASAIAQQPAGGGLAARPSNWTAPPYWTPSGGAKDVALEPIPQEADEPGLRPLGGLPTPLPFSAIPPCRIVDTRGANGPFGGPALVANATRTFNLPAGPCAGIPGNVAAYSLNFTVIGGSGVFTNAFLTAWATGDTQPVVSTLNFNANQLESNAAVVPAGTSGSINVFVNAPGHLLIDINGYYTPVGIVNFLNGLSGSVSLAAGTNISITPSSQTLTIANTAPAAWELAGNSGTTPASNFVGTTDDQPFVIKVNNQRAMRFEPHTATMVPNVIGGSGNNSVTAGVYSATIGGGGFAPNTVTDSGGTVGGGSGNRAGDNAGTTVDQLAATVGGGSGNVASSAYSFVGGGQNNTSGAVGFWTTVAGGIANLAQADGATVGGGGNNTANNAYTTVPGGRSNAATQVYAFAAGRRAKAIHQGAFVWGDSNDADVFSTANNEFSARALGGFRFYPAVGVTCTLTDATGWQCGAVSDRNAKREFARVDVRETLDRLMSVPIQTWSYSASDEPVRHMGPMAQDFAAAYSLGADDKTINPVDANGVALASIQALYEMVKEKDAEIDALKARLSKLEAKTE